MIQSICCQCMEERRHDYTEPCQKYYNVLGNILHQFSHFKLYVIGNQFTGLLCQHKTYLLTISMNNFAVYHLNLCPALSPCVELLRIILLSQQIVDRGSLFFPLLKNIYLGSNCKMQDVLLKLFLSDRSYFHNPFLSDTDCRMFSVRSYLSLILTFPPVDIS